VKDPLSRRKFLKLGLLAAACVPAFASQAVRIERRLGFNNLHTGGKARPALLDRRRLRAGNPPRKSTASCPDSPHRLRWLAIDTRLASICSIASMAALWHVPALPGHFRLPFTASNRLLSSNSSFRRQAQPAHGRQSHRHPPARCISMPTCIEPGLHAAERSAWATNPVPISCILDVGRRAHLGG